jgi:hypothetical protein
MTKEKKRIGWSVQLSPHPVPLPKGEGDLPQLTQINSIDNRVNRMLQVSSVRPVLLSITRERGIRAPVALSQGVMTQTVSNRAYGTGR